MSKKKFAAGILFTDGEKILILRRNDEGRNGGKWDIPAGGCKKGESPRENAMREAMEECGHNHGENFSVLVDRDNKRTFTMFFHHVQEQFEAKLSFEHVDWKWVTIKEALEYDLHPKLKTKMGLIEEIVNNKVSFKEWIAA